MTGSFNPPNCEVRPKSEQNRPQFLTKPPTTMTPNTIRQKLVDAIVELTGSELNEFTHKDFIDLAKESDSQLIDRLIHISHWYKNEYDNE